MSAANNRSGQAAREGLALLALVAIAAGCGTSKHAAKTTAPATTTVPTSSTPTPATPNALQGEAGSAATGDIPDNQVFVTFANARSGYSIKYPEGWAESGSAARVAFRDKNNIVRIVVQRGPAPTVASVLRDMTALRSSAASLSFHVPAAMRIGGARAIKVVYTTKSAPNALTNKRVELTVDRYYLSGAGKVAIVDLGTPVGVDNVDAYRLMIQSFRWR